jgi:hypothetical protein
MNKIFFIPKQSSLVRKYPVWISNGGHFVLAIRKPDFFVRFSNGFNKMAANYGSHLVFSI